MEKRGEKANGGASEQAKEGIKKRRNTRRLMRKSRSAKVTDRTHTHTHMKMTTPDVYRFPYSVNADLNLQPNVNKFGNGT